MRGWYASEHWMLPAQQGLGTDAASTAQIDLCLVFDEYFLALNCTPQRALQRHAFVAATVTRVEAAAGAACHEQLMIINDGERGDGFKDALHDRDDGLLACIVRQDHCELVTAECARMPTLPIYSFRR